MTELPVWFDFATAAVWFVLAVTGLVLRTRRLLRLRRIVLVEPADERDREYLASIVRSTWLRLLVKVVFLIGSLIALFNLPLFGLWRLGVIVALACMIAETLSVDRVRDRLGRAARVR